MKIGHTITEKIIAAKVGVAETVPGKIHEVPVDVAFIHDNNAPITISEFARLPNAKIWNPNRVHFVLDHHSPATTNRAAQHHENIRGFARKFGAKVWDVGRGVSHPVMAEEGLARPGRVIVGTDSHTVGLGAFGCMATGIGSTEMTAVLATGKIWMKVPETIKVVLDGKLPGCVTARDVALYLLGHFGPSFLNYAAMEFYGTLLTDLSAEERMAITIMTLEMGVKNALMPVDATTVEYIGGLRQGDEVVCADADAVYSSVLTFDVSNLTPIVAGDGSHGNFDPTGYAWFLRRGILSRSGIGGAHSERQKGPSRRSVHHCAQQFKGSRKSRENRHFERSVRSRSHYQLAGLRHLCRV